jgi:hypothetical protein
MALCECICCNMHLLQHASAATPAPAAGSSCFPLYLTPRLTLYLTPRLTLYLTPRLTLYLTPRLTLYLTPRISIRLTPRITIRLTHCLTLPHTRRSIPSLSWSSTPTLLTSYARLRDTALLAAATPTPAPSSQLPTYSRISTWARPC